MYFELLNSSSLALSKEKRKTAFHSSQKLFLKRMDGIYPKNSTLNNQSIFYFKGIQFAVHQHEEFWSANKKYGLWMWK